MAAARALGKKITSADGVGDAWKVALRSDGHSARTAHQGAAASPPRTGMPRRRDWMAAKAMIFFMELKMLLVPMMRCVQTLFMEVM